LNIHFLVFRKSSHGYSTVQIQSKIRSELLVRLNTSDNLILLNY